MEPSKKPTGFVLQKGRVTEILQGLRVAYGGLSYSREYNGMMLMLHVQTGANPFLLLHFKLSIDKTTLVVDEKSDAILRLYGPGWGECWFRLQRHGWEEIEIVQVESENTESQAKSE